MVIQTIPFAADISEPDEDVLAPSEVELTPKAAKMGVQLVERLTGDGATLVDAEDDAVRERHALVAELLKGKKPRKTTKAKPKKTADIEAALEEALA
jgi:non-homologous end joining protein Ku